MNLGHNLRVYGLAVALGLSTAVIAGPKPAYAAAQSETQVTAWKQAVAEAAGDDRDIAAFYRSNGFQPIWTGSSDEDRARRAALFAAMEMAPEHGLPADRYDSAALMRTLGNVSTSRDRGFAEVAMSKAFIQLARDMQSGVLNPSDVDDGIKRNGIYRDATTYLTGISENRPRHYIRTLVPQTREYARLMKEKLRLQTLAANGGWGPTVQASALKRGDTGMAVVQLRNRLMKMGYLPRTSTMVFDGNIENAVSRFQAAHGLDPDGVAGSTTITKINRSPGSKLASVLVAMERERWLNKERGARHVLVNLTDFSARIIDHDVITFETKSVVGATDAKRRTVEFSDEMDHMVINPTWNVPRSITVGSYLPQLQRNPGSLGHLRLYDGSGRQVSRAGINFGAYNARTFPFDLKQPPSKGNALGLVKFMFPNRYNIYLHDTPQKHLFARERRAYSHGCIRLHQPFDFAYEMLSVQETDPKTFFHDILATGQETRVELVNPVPVHIIYRTAFTDAKGRPQYREDIYGRDARIWAFLQREGVTAPGVEDARVAAVTYRTPASTPTRTRAPAQGQAQARQGFQVVPQSQPAFRPVQMIERRANVPTRANIFNDAQRGN